VNRASTWYNKVVFNMGSVGAFVFRRNSKTHLTVDFHYVLKCRRSFDAKIPLEHGVDKMKVSASS
jgi:hypothetical protein